MQWFIQHTSEFYNQPPATAPVYSGAPGTHWTQTW